MPRAIAALQPGALTEDQRAVREVNAYVGGVADGYQQAIAAHQPAIFHPLTIPYKGDKEHYFSYCATHRLTNFGKVRVVINHRQADLSDKPVYYITNQLHWQAAGITRIRRGGC